MAFAVSNLSKYDLLIRGWTLGQINDKIAAIGTPMRLMGRKDTLEEVQALTDMKAGDFWVVGTEDAAEKVEYVYTLAGTWELLGTTAVSLDGYVNETQLFKGNDPENVGTAAAPAAGTILATYADSIETNKNAIDAINDEETGILAQAKEYADGLVDEESAIAQRVAALETVPTDEDIVNMFNANTATLG